MARCKDCFHWEACKEMYEAMGNSLPEDFSGSTERCNTFVPAVDVVPKSEVDKLEYTLLGVMHSVDKWLEGDELEQDEVNRAATMREKTLRIIENAKTEAVREIFEEIDRICVDTFGNFNHRVFAELKKKHIRFKTKRG